MPLNNFGVLKGKAVDVRLATNQSAHYQVHLVADATNFRIAINVRSQLQPSELEYLIVDNYAHPITSMVEDLPLGFNTLNPGPIGGALDYIRGNLFDRRLMTPIPFSLPGPDNDLNDKLHRIMQRAMADEDAVVYAFGERWGPENNARDRFFAFLPGNGVHDIHMNQSNVGNFVQYDGVWQDGGLFVHFPRQNQWAAVFLKFQSQGWHTDDVTGHKIGDEVPPGAVTPGNTPPIGGPQGPVFNPTPGESQGMVRIVAALVNSTRSPEIEIVTLLNTAPNRIELAGWGILDKEERKHTLNGVIEPGEIRQITIVAPVALSNQGGLITLIDSDGLKIDGVAYTRAQASHPGWTIVF